MSNEELSISLPPLDEQRRFIFEQATLEAINTLTGNLKAPEFGCTELDSDNGKHLLKKGEGWEAPSGEVVKAYFENFKQAVPEHGTDKAIAKLLGLSSDRRVRDYKEGKAIPYDIWRRFLILTGRVPQEVLPVLGYFREEVQ